MGTEGITVEMACLYTSWLCPSRRNSTEKLSNDVAIPCSLTPLTRNIVIGVLFLRMLCVGEYHFYALLFYRRYAYYKNK